MVWARWKGPWVERLRWATVLIGMQVIYVCFAVFEAFGGELPVRGLGLELALLVICSFLASRAWRRQSIFLPIGYLLHGSWDLVHELAGTDYVVAGYPEMCVAYDWFLMLYFLTRLRVWSQET